MDIFTKATLVFLGISFIVLVFLWFKRVAALVDSFLKSAQDILSNHSLIKKRVSLFYQKEEIKGDYKDREVIIGVSYAGFKGEYLALPFIQMRLKEARGYNTNRLPNYAKIEKNYLIFIVNLSVVWGVFDKNYPHIFDKNYLIIALEKMLSTAQDVERDRA